MDLTHMRRFAISTGRLGGLITEITWKEDFVPFQMGFVPFRRNKQAICRYKK